MKEKRTPEVWYRAKSRMDRVAMHDKVRVLRVEMVREGITEDEAVCRSVEEYFGKNPSDDQVRDLAAIFSSVFGMKRDRFVTLWLCARSRR